MSPIEPTAPQQIQVLAALRRGPSCLQDFGSAAYVARNRCGDLRRLGWHITAVPCRRHAHHGRVAEYRLPEGAYGEIDGSPATDPPLTSGAAEVSPTAAPLGLFPEHSRALGHGR